MTEQKKETSADGSLNSAIHSGYRITAFGPMRGVLTLSAEHISCGCCRGPESDRCCCWNHMDIPRGIQPKVCSRHGHLFSSNGETK
jgi:hypothetical protein